jgi:hypothetical protein
MMSFGTRMRALGWLPFFASACSAPQTPPSRCDLPPDVAELPSAASEIALAGCSCRHPCLGPPRGDGAFYSSEFRITSATDSAVAECTRQVAAQADVWAKRHGLAFDRGSSTPRRFDRFVVVPRRWFIEIYYSAPAETAELYVGIVAAPSTQPDVLALERAYGTPLQIVKELETAACKE